MAATPRNELSLGFQVVLDPSLDGTTNMDRDAEMLAAAEKGEALARVYGWDGPWVSLGRFQNPDRALVSGSPAQWVKRPTGGKAVLHGHDVTVSIAAPLLWLGVPDHEARRVSTVYRAIVGPLVEALASAGLPAVLAERTEHVKNAGHTADCFAHVSPNDIVDPSTGEKVCGCALRVTDSAVLLQASVPFGRPLVDPSRVFLNPHLPANVRSVEPARVAGALQTFRRPCLV